MVSNCTSSLVLLWMRMIRKGKKAWDKLSIFYMKAFIHMNIGGIVEVLWNLGTTQHRTFQTDCLTLVWEYSSRMYYCWHCLVWRGEHGQAFYTGRRTEALTSAETSFQWWIGVISFKSYSTWFKLVLSNSRPFNLSSASRCLCCAVQHCEDYFICSFELAFEIRQLILHYADSEVVGRACYPSSRAECCTTTTYMSYAQKYCMVVMRHIWHVL